MRRLLCALLLLGLGIGPAAAQTITASGPCPPGAVGFNPGTQCFRTDTGQFFLWDGTVWRQLLTINGTLVLPPLVQFSPVAFSALDPAAANGTVVSCSDCLQASNPCTGASTGTLAMRVNNTWKCY